MALGHTRLMTIPSELRYQVARRIVAVGDRAVGRSDALNCMKRS
jgi:hypothetical protein